jgi:excisionase family DNA binding protein
VSALPEFPAEPDLSPRQAAELAGCSYWTVLKEIERGNLRAFRRPGGKLAIRRDDFCAWAYGTPVEPKEREEPAARAPRRRRARPARGSVAALHEIERQAET